MKYFVTGVNGQLGFDILKELIESDHDVVGSDIQLDFLSYEKIKCKKKIKYKELDLTNEIEVANLIDEIKPDVIIHCAAWTAVDLSLIHILFDIDVNYYTRINFSSLIKIVDVLGGVDIYNDQEFTSLHGKFHFPQGNIHLNGEEALGYARERYSLRDGDLDRGKNHEKILKAIIEKILSPAILFNYADVLQVMMESSETNIPKEKIIELVNDQIQSKGKWDIDTAEVKGTPQSGLPSYAMPGWNLYMYVLEESSIKEINTKIKQLIEK